MENSLQFLELFSVALLVLSLPVYAQPGLQCTPAMINSLTPCMTFLNNVTANVSNPTPDCCNSLKSLTTNSSGCFCSLVSGNVPFPIPVNRTLAISLPQACNMPGVPVQCKASTAAPVPAPGPSTTLPLSPSPAASPPAASPPVAPTPTTPVADTPSPPAAETPTASTSPGTTTTPTDGSGGTTTTAPSPSSAVSLNIATSFVVVVGFGMLLMISA